MIRTRSPRRAALALALALGPLLLGGCAGLREALSPAPEGVPSGRPGWLVYTVGALRFEAPETWRASGSARKLRLEAPDGNARLDVSTPEQPFEGEQACLADAEAVLKRGEAMERARRHPTRFAGARAFSFEGDSAGWHVWAWAACDGGSQYQVFFTARTPAGAEAIDAWRTLSSSARIGGQA
ncbi:conserved hypothetical protein [Anaeromyxobacter dehalogenans 2CP-1]|uniref:Lipoprotein n=1 Tax=Anaeromyxobacter dehalogenans (strain ATCC BAA-258 / DSM 21875 / 2CP-1) TaxID=455488 RepID=B8JC69_ANAD2|nr:hypothetical protein [Anaeromyxobacter dehalogenans]ACL65809.1 conserved hypothetical protein [Anaeromyxobacter dehalogenans 2CP-1]